LTNVTVGPTLRKTLRPPDAWQRERSREEGSMLGIHTRPKPIVAFSTMSRLTFPGSQ